MQSDQDDIEDDRANDTACIQCDDGGTRLHLECSPKRAGKALMLVFAVQASSFSVMALV